MQVSLFSLIQFLKGKISVESGELFIPQLKKSRENQNYYLFPNLKQSNLQNQNENWAFSEGHLTIFETQSEKEGVLSAYHYTAILKSSPQKAILIHIYFDRNDKLCNPIYIAQINPKTRAVLQLEPNFFQNSAIKDAFTHETIRLISPIIISLRTEQRKLISRFQSQYLQLTREMEEVSKDQLNTGWDPDVREKFLANALQCIGVLENWKPYSNTPEEHDALIKIFRNYQSIPIFVSSNATQENEPEMDSLEPKKRSLEKTGSKKESFHKNILPFKHNILSIINRKKINFAQAKELQQFHCQLEILFNESVELTGNQVFEILDLELLICNKLRFFCIQAVNRGAVVEVEIFQSFLLALPEEILISIIEKDNDRTLSFLIEKGILSINTKLKDCLLYEKAYQSKKVGCVNVYLDHGVPPIAMIYRNMVIFNSKKSLDRQQLMQFINAFQQMNRFFVPLLKVEKYDMLLDNTTAFLSKKRSELLSIKETENRQISIKNKRTHNAVKNSPTETNINSTNLAVAIIDCALHFSSITKFLMPIFKKNNHLILQKVTETSLMSISQALPADMPAVTLPSFSLIQLQPISDFLKVINDRLNAVPTTKKELLLLSFEAILLYCYGDGDTPFSYEGFMQKLKGLFTSNTAMDSHLSQIKSILKINQNDFMNLLMKLVMNSTPQIFEQINSTSTPAQIGQLLSTQGMFSLPQLPPSLNQIEDLGCPIT